MHHGRAVRTLVAAALLAAPASASGYQITAPRDPEGDGLVFHVTPEPGDDLINVTMTPVGVTATGGQDFDDAPQTMTLPPTGADVTVPTIEDETYEGDETLDLHVGGDVGRGTIADDEPLLSVADATANEHAGTAAVTITASTAPAHDVTVPLSGRDGTATAPGDYSVPGSATLKAGETSVVVAVPLVDDTADEADETFSVLLGTPSPNAGVGDGEGVVTVTDDDQRNVDLLDTGTPEGDSGSSVARFTVHLSAPTFRTVTVRFTTADGQATAPADYLARLGTVVVQPGQTTAFVDVSVVGDTRAEPSEAFELRVTEVVGARLGDGVAVGVIQDDDGTAPGGGGPPGGGTTSSSDAKPPKMTLSGPKASGRRLTLRIACPRGERSCTGRVVVYTVPERRSKVRSLRRERRLGAKSFTLRGGRAKTLTITVPPSVLKAARKARHLKVQAFAVTHDAAGNVDTRTRGATLRFRKS